MTTSADGHDILPCGCECWNEGGEGGQFMFRPCSMSCKYYRYIVEQAAKESKPLFKVYES